MAANGKVEINRNKCIYCGACAGVCPVLALRLNDIIMEWDKDKCVLCGSCEKICPAGAIKVKRD